jgi:hypothetical protein
MYNSTVSTVRISQACEASSVDGNPARVASGPGGPRYVRGKWTTTDLMGNGAHVLRRSAAPGACRMEQWLARAPSGISLRT